MEIRFSSKTLIIILPAIFIVAGAVLFCRFPKPEVKNVAVSKDSTPFREISADADFNKQLFYPSVAKYPKVQSQENAHFYGGIITHHDLRSDLIAQFFSKLSQDRKIKTFVILGPNHANKGLSPVISGKVRWQTSIGDVNNDYDFLDKLKEDGSMSYDEENFQKDHAIKTLVPFIKHYFPDAKIVPLLFTSEQTMKKDMLLAQKIKGLSDDNTFILASLDFSHYLSVDAAEEKDRVTLSAIQRRDYNLISSFNNDYIDSPWALVTFLRIMELENAGDPQIIAHTNSGKFSGSDLTDTTSYFSVVYGE